MTNIGKTVQYASSLLVHDTAIKNPERSFLGTKNNFIKCKKLKKKMKLTIKQKDALQFNLNNKWKMK